MVRDGGGEFQSSTFFFLGEAKWMGVHMIFFKMWGACWVVTKIPCIASNRQLFPQVGLYLEANKNAIFVKKLDFWYVKYWYRIRPLAESSTTHNTSSILLCLGMHHVLYIGYIQHNQYK